MKVLEQDENWIHYLAEKNLSKEQVLLKEFFPQAYCMRTANNRLFSINNNSNRFNQVKKELVNRAIVFSRIKHPNTLNPSSVFEENNSVYFVLESLEFQSIDDFLKTKPTLSVKNSLEFILQIGSALEYLHDHGLIHLNVNPKNIYISKNGITKLWLMGDQSIPEYMALEQSNGSKAPSYATDIYGLGACFYFLVNGQNPPVPAQDPVTYILHKKSSHSKIPASIPPIISKAMAIQIEDLSLIHI